MCIRDRLTKLELAEVININSRYELALQIDANIDTTAQVRLYKGNTLIADESAEIHKGETRMVFSDITTTGGGVTYRAEIIPAQDTMAENNRVYAYTYIEDIPRILVVEQDDSGREWESMPVSYTHLDVYKRQAYGGAVFEMVYIWRNSGRHFMPCRCCIVEILDGNSGFASLRRVCFAGAAHSPYGSLFPAKSDGERNGRNGRRLGRRRANDYHHGAFGQRYAKSRGCLLYTSCDTDYIPWCEGAGIWRSIPAFSGGRHHSL